jgi:ferredoxin
MAHKVEFKKSGKVIEWRDQYESILELAEANGIEIESDCRQGYCGSCMVKLLSGEVDMESTDGLDESDVDNKMILTCVAVPKTDVVLEA